MPKKRILIADDGVFVRQILKEFLQDRRNIEVCGEAANGFEAIQRAKELQPDLILLDLAMPEMNGAEAASVLKKLMPTVPIIIFTMYSQNIGKSLTSALGVDLVLSKPDGMRALVRALEVFAAGHLDAGKPLEALLSEQPTEDLPEAPRIVQADRGHALQTRRRVLDGAIKVLVADGHEFVRRPIVDLLMTNPGIVVVGEVTDFADLFSMATALQPDVLLIEARMLEDSQFAGASPSSEGLPCAKCILAMSIFPDDATQDLANRFGARRVLDKSYLGAELIPAVLGCATGEP